VTNPVDLPRRNRHAKGNTQPAMTQKQREALFDLLTVSIYADAHIALEEERLMDLAFVAEGWESGHPKALFLDQSNARARAAAESDATMDAYIAEKAAVFTDPASQIEAYGVVSNVISRDGLATDEIVFLSKLKAAFPKV
jgi:hypothetical protein